VEVLLFTPNGQLQLHVYQWEKKLHFDEMISALN